jgi:pimeloyl-ACP methyl ester carboxylesterase
MDYTEWKEAHLTQARVGGKTKTSVWLTPGDSLPLAVMVHGISGDHSGLVPLAAELSDEYRLAIIELPGHGDSDPIPLPDAASLQEWFYAALGEVEKEFGEVSVIIAHSFGCSAVLGETLLDTKKVVLLCPVPTPSEMYARYSRIIMRSAHFWAHIYNWRLFVLMRSVVLTKVRTREALRRIRWVGLYSQPSYKQVVFQAGLVDMILDGSAYRHVKDGVALVVCGMWDTTAVQRDSLDMEGVFGEAKTVFLAGGHLVPIETPARVAAVIREAMLH